MSWIITGREAGPADPYIGNVSLLLHGDGANGSTTIVDSSPSPKTVTAVGDAQISTAIADPFNNNTGVIALDGTGDYLTVPIDTSFIFGTQDFTVEGWVKIAQAKNTGLFQIALNSYFFNSFSNSIGLFIGSAGEWGLYARNIVSIDSSNPSSLNTWYYCAVVRHQTTTQLYIDGISRITVTSDSTNYTCNSLAIGGIFSTSNLLNGYIDDFHHQRYCPLHQ